MTIRKTNKDDQRFLEQMNYHAVYWRNPLEAPALEEALTTTWFTLATSDWMHREGDFGLIAEVDGQPVGAAWYRFYNTDRQIRGYYHEDVPVIVIGLLEAYRHRGIGYKLLESLISLGPARQVSLCVSKDNYAFKLYEKCGFEVIQDIGDSYIMLKTKK